LDLHDSFGAGARAERVVQIQFGVDSLRFSPAAVDASVLRGMGLDERPFVFSPRAAKAIYNHETILTAFARLGDGYQLAMTGRNAEPAYRAQIGEQMTDLGIRGRVRLIDDIADDAMLALFRAAGVVVSAPISDSFPITLLEAMACGTPIVAGDLPPVRAVLQDLAPDSLVPTLDAEAMAAALRAALELPEVDRRQRAAALRERAVTTADYETNMLRMEELYRGLVARKRS